MRQHLVVVLSLETVRGHEALEADLVEAVLQLRCLVGGVDVDQDQARLGRGELGQVPLVGVGTPDTNPVTSFNIVFISICRKLNQPTIPVPGDQP